MHAGETLQSAFGTVDGESALFPAHTWTIVVKQKGQKKQSDELQPVAPAQPVVTAPPDPPAVVAWRKWISLYAMGAVAGLLVFSWWYSNRPQSSRNDSGLNRNQRPLGDFDQNGNPDLLWRGRNTPCAAS